jgi:hypothetical protein
MLSQVVVTIRTNKLTIAEAMKQRSTLLMSNPSPPKPVPCAIGSIAVKCSFYEISFWGRLEKGRQ